MKTTFKDIKQRLNNNEFSQLEVLKQTYKNIDTENEQYNFLVSKVEVKELADNKLPLAGLFMGSNRTISLLLPTAIWLPFNQHKRRFWIAEA